MDASTRHQQRRHLMRQRFRRFHPRRWLPEETRMHLRNASREELLVARSLLDAAVARLERRDNPPPLE